MKQATQIKIIIGISLITLAILIWLVWGNTLLMAQANRSFKTGALDQARRGYQSLQQKSAHSPVPFHNLGLCDYLQGAYPQSLNQLRQAAQQVELPKQAKLKQTNGNSIYYHLGNALFKTTEKEANQTAGLQAALDSYQKAILADPNDLDAKYNYELTKLRLEQSQQKKDSNDQSQNKKENKNSSDGKKPPQNDNSNTNQNPNQNQSQSAQNHSLPKPNQGQMTKQEAAALLKMSENAAQYQGPVVPGKATTDKDW